MQEAAQVTCAGFAAEEGAGSGGAVATAGMASGHAAVADARTGEVVALWRAHGGAVSAACCRGAVELLTGSQVLLRRTPRLPMSGHCRAKVARTSHSARACPCITMCSTPLGAGAVLVIGSSVGPYIIIRVYLCWQDSTLKLWDLRMLHAPGAALHTFSPFRAPVGGAALLGGDAIAWATGAERPLAVLKLTPPYGEAVTQVRLDGGGAPGLWGTAGTGALVGAAMLPLSRLLLLGTSDGHVRVCC